MQVVQQADGNAEGMQLHQSQATTAQYDEGRNSPSSALQHGLGSLSSLCM